MEPMFHSPEMMPPVFQKQAKERQPESQLRVEIVKPDDPTFAEAQHIEYEVFKKQQFTAAEGLQFLPEYTAYDKNSSFITVYGENDQLMGVLREIRNTKDQAWVDHGTTGFKTLDDFKLYLQWGQYLKTVSPQSVLEVGTAAVPDEFRSPRLQVVDHLYHTLYTHAIQEGRTNLIASIDNKLLLLYSRYFNFQPIGPAITDYMGSDTTPVFSDVRDINDYIKAADEKRYRRLILGDFST